MSSNLDRSLVNVYFEDLFDGFRELPNCISHCSPDFLGYILSCHGDQPAMIGGGSSLIDESGELLAGASSYQRFESWKYSANRNWLLDKGPFPILGIVSVIVPASTNKALVNSLSEVLCRDGHFLSLEESIPLLAEFIVQLDWCYIPLTEETFYALYISGSIEPHNEVIRCLEEREIDYFSLGSE